MRGNLIIVGIVVITVLMSGCATMSPKTKAKDDINLDKIPPAVMDGLKAKFPNAEIHKWDKEKEGNVVVYDIEFKQWGRNFEADIKEDGSIYNWEKAIKTKDLPKVVKNTVNTKYTNSTITEIMKITAVEDGRDVLEGYEITLKTADMKEVEVTVAPDGKILEESEEEE